jgi:NitT/TauT family transport system substrate-binding protein
MSHRPFTRRAASAVAGLAVVALAATGCGGGSADTGGGGGSGDTGKTTTIRIGTLPTANAAAMYLGMQEGFFDDQKLKVEPTVLQGGNEIITGMVAGDYDFGFVGYISAGVAAGKGVPICVATASDAAGTNADDDFQVYVAAGNSPINGPKDFAGKTLGINALGGVAEVMTRAALDKEGVDSSSVKFVEVPFPEVPAAVSGGRIDAGFTAEPFVTTVLGQGGKVVFAPQSDLGAHYPNGSYATSKQFFKDSPDVIKRFDAAITKSLKFAQDNPDAVRKIIPTYTKIPPDVAAKMRLPVFTADLDKKAIDEQMGFLEKYKVVDKAPSAKDLICS